MTEGEALSLVAILAASYPKNDLSKANLAAYATMLQDLEFVATGEAVKRLICTAKWFPAISEIRTEVAEAKCVAIVEPELAWAEVLQKIGSCGLGGSPEWSTPVMAFAVDAVGWRAICLDENVASTRARFIDAYKAVRLRAVDVQRLGSHAMPGKRLGRSTSIKALLKGGTE
jgi:hypothetical protein